MRDEKGRACTVRRVVVAGCIASVLLAGVSAWKLAHPEPRIVRLAPEAARLLEIQTHCETGHVASPWNQYLSFSQTSCLDQRATLEMSRADFEQYVHLLGLVCPPAESDAHSTQFTCSRFGNDARLYGPGHRRNVDLMHDDIAASGAGLIAEFTVARWIEGRVQVRDYFFQEQL